MPTLTIKNVPAAVVERLRSRAERNHRSMQGELMALICRAVEPEPNVEAGLQTGATSIDEIAAEHRARWPEPFDQGPRAVDVIRRERDAR